MGETSCVGSEMVGTDTFLNSLKYSLGGEARLGLTCFKHFKQSKTVIGLRITNSRQVSQPYCIHVRTRQGIYGQI